MVGGMPSMTVMDWSGAASIPLPAISATASAPMSSCGVAIPLTVVLWVAESVRVMVVEESTVRVVTSPSERPPVDSPASRTAMLP